MGLERREHHEDTKGSTNSDNAVKAACGCLRPRLCGYASPLSCSAGQLLQQSHPKESHMGIRRRVRRRRNHRHKYRTSDGVQAADRGLQHREDRFGACQKHQPFCQRYRRLPSYRSTAEREGDCRPLRTREH